MPSLTVTETSSFEFDLTAGAQSSKYPLKEVLGRMFPVIYNSNFSIFSIRDFVGQGGHCKLFFKW